MLTLAYNIVKARRWQEMRRRIQALPGVERMRLLGQIADDIRMLAPVAAHAATIERDDTDRAAEAADIYSVIIGAWLALDPTNPGWPGRDRLFVSRRDDLICACSALSSLGFFPADQVPGLVEEVDAEGSRAVVPGLENPGASSAEIPDLVWASALESARSKKRWRSTVGSNLLNASWVDPHWRGAPESWRTCVVLDAVEPVTLACRDLPLREGDKPAGLLALVKAPGARTADIVETWGKAGWDTASIDHDDAAQIYEALSTAYLHRPLALVLTMDNTAEKIPHIFDTRRESVLLGEMSDEQFSAIIGESLQL